MTQILELPDKGVKAVILKMFQLAIMNILKTPETNQPTNQKALTKK